jgi:death-on-curing family protein
MDKLVIYQTKDHKTEIRVAFDDETVWLNRQQISDLFDRDIKTIGKHVNNVFKEGELDKDSVVALFATTASDGKTYQVEHYNLDVIISVGYRVKSQRGTQFRQWATQRLKDYLVEGYAINQKRLAEKDMEVKTLKTGIQILSATLKDHIKTIDEAKGLTILLDQFDKGLTLLDDYDHESLDEKGKNAKQAKVIAYKDFKSIIAAMTSDFSSDIFGQEKDDSFKSAIRQIYQTFEENDLYPSLEEKAATLLYLVVKNHAFVDGNKRIAAACFLYFLEKNDLDPVTTIGNDALATLTLFIAASKPNDMKTVIRLVISLLNRAETHG